ncbi:MAG: OsmC family protein [Longimicrobiales bacterium]
MLGTLNGALEVRGVNLEADAIIADVEGFNQLEDRIPVLTRVHVHYRLRIPAGSRERVERALASHVDKCPTARSLKPAVEVTWEANIVEV